MEPKMIAQSQDYFILDKPAGWITDEANTTGSQPVVQTWLKDNLDYELKNNRECRNGIVHRLDKETSGILIVAKNENAYRILQKQFKERAVKKTYLALVHGKLEVESGEVEAAVGRLPWRRDRFGVLPGGREAVTVYNLVANYMLSDSKDEFSLVRLKPRSGRTHQIRVHMKYLSHPLVADEFYAGRKTARKDRKWCPRLFLHAETIEFIDPSTKKTVKYTSDLPTDLETVLKKLSKVL